MKSLELKPKALNESKTYNFRHKTQRKLKPFKTNLKGRIKIWIPKSEIIYDAGISKRNGKTKIMVPG